MIITIIIIIIIINSQKKTTTKKQAGNLSVHLGKNRHEGGESTASTSDSSLWHETFAIESSGRSRAEMAN